MQDGDELVHRAGSGFIAGIVGQRLGIDDTFSGSVYRKNRSAICHDTSALAQPARAPARDQVDDRRAAPPRRRHRRDPVGALADGRTRSPTRISKTLELLSVVLSAAISHAAEFEARRAQVGSARPLPHGVRGSVGRDRQGRSGRTHAGSEPGARADARLHGGGARGDDDSRRSPTPTTSSTTSSSSTS